MPKHSRTVKVVVLAINDSGPTLVPLDVKATASEIKEGYHFILAKDLATSAGYKEPMVSFDASTPAAGQLVEVSKWLQTAS